MKTQKIRKIAAIGGGTGLFSILSGLRDDFDVTAIVTMADDGGSTGVLREEFGILPPGDIRRALVALSTADNEMLAKLFSYRFERGGGLNGHSFGNLMIAALERLTGSFAAAVKEAEKILAVRGRAVPVTLQSASLIARLADGRVVKGETNIDVPKHDGHLKIEKIWLEPKPKANPEAVRAITSADAVIIGPGDLFTSLIPNLLVPEVRRAVVATKAKKIYFVNLMTKFGETTNFRASDFLKTLEDYLGKGVLDFVVVNSKKPTIARLKKYATQKSNLVVCDGENLSGRPVLATADLIRPHGFVRHDARKVAKIIRMLV